MNVLARLWDRVSGSQPLPPAWVIGLTALLAIVVVLDTRSWRLAGKVITIAHEGGHALVSVLSGRRLDGIRLHADSSGVTYSRAGGTAPGWCSPPRPATSCRRCSARAPRGCWRRGT